MLATLPFLVCYFSLTALVICEDIHRGLLPDKYLCPLLWVGLLYHLCLRPDFLSSAVIGAVTGYLGFAFIYWGFRLFRKREGLGYGDVKYLATLGAWHGWSVLPMLAATASCMALLYVLTLSLLRSDKGILKNPLPFGPFLAAAGLCTGWQSLINLPP